MGGTSGRVGGKPFRPPLSGNDFPIGARAALVRAAGGEDAISTTPTHVVIREELVCQSAAAMRQGI